MDAHQQRGVRRRGIDNTEIIQTIHQRPAPMIPATSGLEAAPDRQQPRGS
ncbi:MAG: hypothetical protein JO372_02645 [Solirubrobacterales bacterium]|nr:hypothetical protein [Solirubrobacterales bacterium]